MKKLYYTFIYFSLILIVPGFSLAQESPHSLYLEVAMADMAGYSGMDGQRYLFEYQHTDEDPLGFVAGVSLVQTINKVMPDDPKVVNNPELIREGYNGSSIDAFVGTNMDLFSTSRFSLPFGFGSSFRLRAESYPDPNSDLLTVPFTTDESGNRAYIVMTETIYEDSFDMGFFGSLSAGVEITEHFGLNLTSRYHFYNKGFSTFSSGIGARYSF